MKRNGEVGGLSASQPYPSSVCLLGSKRPFHLSNGTKLQDVSVKRREYVRRTVGWYDFRGFVRKVGPGVSHLGSDPDADII